METREPREPRAPDRPTGGFRLGRLFGVDVEVDWSLAIIFALITFNLGAGVFPGWHPEWSPKLTWAVATAAAFLFFGSVLVHELSHAVVARAQGIPVRRITLFLFGGVAHMEKEPPSPRSEFFMAVVGPLTSLLIGIASTVAGGAMVGGSLEGAIAGSDPEAARRALDAMGPVATLLLWLGPVNVALGLFNILPGYPLDGGRVLRAAIWAATGNVVKATRWASFSGQAVAGGLMALGAVQLLTGSAGQGIWLLLIGWFLRNAARASYQQILGQHALEAIPVARVMRTHLDRVPPELSLESFVQQFVLSSDQQAFPVESQGTLRGIVTADDVQKVPRERWPRTSVEDVMTPADRLPSLPPDAAADLALAELSRQDLDQIPVLEGGRLLGLVRRRDISKWLAFGGPRTQPLPT